MKLSIIIPVYNVEPFLRRCLDSIIVPEEYIHDVEVIIVDDGSTDNSGEICDEERDRVGFTIIHQKNKGVCAARNVALGKAMGDYIMFLDSDDCLADGAVETMLKLADKGEDIIQFNFLKCMENKCTLAGRHACFNKYYYLSALPPYWVLVWNKIYKRSFLEEHNIRFFEGMKYDDDTQFNIQCFRYMENLPSSDVVIVKHYYDNEGSVTHTLSREKFISATEIMLDMLREDNPPMVDRIIRERIVFKWSSKQYVRMFGGD